MAKQLFRLRNVPEDEAEEIRQLLTEAQIDFYETPGGNWGISMPALWLKDETQWDRAKALIDEYQQQRQAAAQAEAKTIDPLRAGWARFLQSPLQFTLYIALIALVIYASLMPFFGLS